MLHKLRPTRLLAERRRFGKHARALTPLSPQNGATELQVDVLLRSRLYVEDSEAMSGTAEFTASPFRESPGAMTFTDVVWAHRARGGTATAASVDRAEERYRATVADFERAYGKIVAAYFSERDAAGAAVTQRDPGGPLQRIAGGFAVSDGRSATNLHCATSWATRDDSRAADLVHRCEQLEVRVREVLTPMQARVATQWLFSIVSRILAERDLGGESEVQGEHTAVAAGDEELKRVTAYYERSAALTTRVRVIAGALAAFAGFAIAVAIVVAVSGSVDLDNGAVLAVLAGAAGAVVSLVFRLGQRHMGLEIDVEPRSTYLLGALRPLLGSVFGAAAFLIVDSGILVIGSGSGVAYFLALGFVAGFAERFAHDLVVTVQGPLVERAASARYLETVGLVEGLPTTVTETVRDALRGPELANWSGYASVELVDQSQPVAPKEELTLLVRFMQAEPNVGVARPIEIHGGVDMDPVPFEIRADSDTVYFATEPDPLPVRPGGEAGLSIGFAAPSRAGTHRIWVQILQQNRLVQALPLDLEVRELD